MASRAVLVNFEKSVIEAIMDEFALAVVDQSLKYCWREGPPETFAQFQRILLNLKASSGVLVLAGMSTKSAAAATLSRIIGQKAISIFHENSSDTDWVRETLRGCQLVHDGAPGPFDNFGQAPAKTFLCVEPEGNVPSLAGVVRGCYRSAEEFQFLPVPRGTCPNILIANAANYEGLLYASCSALADLSAEHRRVFKDQVWSADSVEKTMRKFVAAQRRRAQACRTLQSPAAH